jgi:hypothetical protein
MHDRPASASGTKCSSASTGERVSSSQWANTNERGGERQPLQPFPPYAKPNLNASLLEIAATAASSKNAIQPVHIEANAMPCTIQSNLPMLAAKTARCSSAYRNAARPIFRRWRSNHLKMALPEIAFATA